jgi:uncharacterized protein (DUF1800 family)
MQVPFCPHVALALLALLAPLTASAQTARLANISTRGQVGAGAENIFGGFVVAGGPKTVLVRAIGPGLSAFGVPGTLADPKLEIFSGSTKVADNDNWNAVDGASFSQVGAFPLPADSKDAVVVATLQPGAYTAQISGNGASNTGVAILEVYDLGGAGQLVNIATRLAVGTGANAAVAGFVVAPGAGTRKLLVRGVGPALAGFGLSGSLPDPKLTVLDAAGGEVAVASANGGASVLTTAAGQAGAFATTTTDTAVIVNVAPGSYTAQLAGFSGTTSGVALIEVYDITNSTGTPPAFGQSPRLFFASLRGSATGSTASGYATVLFDPNTNTATVSASFSNLSSAQTGAHLVLGSGAGTFVLNLPRGQVSGVPWIFPASGPYSSSAIVAALLNGEIAAQIDTAGFPAGELRSNLIAVRGSTTFTAPAAPPALPAGLLTAPSDVEAARFLIQATFGPTPATIAALRARGINGWLDDQMALPATSAIAALNADVSAFPNPPKTDYYYYTHWNWHPAWWKLALTAPDQLRQRVAFALSELLVVGNLSTIPVKAKVRYYDFLVSGAFGNFRQLLDDISQNPAMGQWLSFKGNQKANPVTGTAPDENYAREVMQLFTIGLVQLQPDGTLMLDTTGQPIPTYNQAMVSEMAKVFTGWTWADFPANTTNAALFTSEFSSDPDRTLLSDGFTWLSPFRYYDAFHDKTAKNIVSLQQVPPAGAQPTVIPANQTGPQDMKAALDTLFNHPNCGPFVSRHLIKFLVTSNPSPGYIHRVAQKFADDGTGTRGNLGAVVRAILTDYEARSPAVLNNIGYGKIKEPLLRFTAFFRALNARAPNGRFLDSFFGDPRNPNPTFADYPIGFLSYPMNQTGQQPLFSRSVFNFFSPTYSPPGAMAAAGLVAPELEITDGTFGLSLPNTFVDFIYRDNAALPTPPSGPSPYLELDYSPFLPNARNPTALVDQLNLILCGGQMSAPTRTQLLSALQALVPSTSDKERVQIALHLTVISPSAATQK